MGAPQTDFMESAVKQLPSGVRRGNGLGASRSAEATEMDAREGIRPGSGRRMIGATALPAIPFGNHVWGKREPIGIANKNSIAANFPPATDW